MDPTLITKLVAAGAMGVSAYCVIKVLDLIKQEQKNPSPRPAFLRTIYVTMGFAILMTVLSLVIEVVRNNMNQKTVKTQETLMALEAKLKHLDTTRYYSINSQGQPEEISISVDNTTEYTISEPYTADRSRDLLKFGKNDADVFQAHREIEDNTYVVGYFDSEDLEKSAKEIFADMLGGSLSPDELLNLATVYSSDTIIIGSDKKDIKKANQYLIDLLALKDIKNSKKRTQAASLLVQPQALRNLDLDHYDILIAELEDGARLQPYKYWDLAQVYWSRWDKTDDKAYYNKYLNKLREYIKVCDRNNLYPNSKDKGIIKTWYDTATSYIAKIPTGAF